nr:dna-directed rna polymerases iv and v subunit 4 [Quercus suber]
MLYMRQELGYSSALPGFLSSDFESSKEEGINISKRSGFCSGTCEVHSEYKYPQRVSNALGVKAERHLYTLGMLCISHSAIPLLHFDRSLFATVSALLSFPDIQVAMEKGAPLRSKGKEDKLKGKDDSSTKKSARKVQFNFEGSPEYKTSSLPKSLGKDDTPFPKGYSGKGGGKGDKIANGGKSTVFKEPQPLELKVEQDLPENVKCMMDCEAFDILQGIQDQLPILSKDPEFRLPVPFDKGLQYAKRGVHYANPQAVRQVLEYP